MKRLLFLLLFNAVLLRTVAQPVSGMTGLLNIPSAEMQADGTFMAGANYLPESLTPATWDYLTGNYFLNITFLPFLELSYRMTLLKNSGDSYNGQDRSVSARLRLLKEKEKIPAIVIGGNDFYTSVGGSGNQYFSSYYAVATKNFQIANQKLSTTMGYAPPIEEDTQFSGVFGGISYSPFPSTPFSLYGEYDTKAFNAGASMVLFKHFYLYAMLHEMKHFAGGFRFTLELY